MASAGYQALLRSLSGYTVVFVQPQYSLQAWKNAGKLTAAAQMEFERQEMREWVKDQYRSLKTFRTLENRLLTRAAR